MVKEGCVSYDAGVFREKEMQELKNKQQVRELESGF